MTANKNFIVLWAEDSEEDKLQIRKAFNRLSEQARLVEVGSGVEALAFMMESSYSNEVPSLVVLDMNMPLLDGRDTLKAIRNNPRFNHIPIFFYSSTTSHIDNFLSTMLGAPLVKKALDGKDCLLAVQQLLGNATSVHKG
ncbi:two-component system, unclassified family, response regulator [Cnuella takakiae]|uniref:Two-component system, unclassified family, response regulator n=2 Tax=Cnuella takakiae TaxID=1302690 RepID=A0A1M5IJW0_9BACT|nr:response regulator [Cnuella takakiae]SHG28644.1 two-component system, unclassified family, response regulator [Cnuella takakiae]